jgi:hypothetical protein
MRPLINIPMTVEERDARRQALLEPMKESLGILSPSFTIESLPDRYVMGPIKYHDGLYRVAWSKTLLDGGARKTQGGWVKFLQSGEWQLGSGPLQIALLSTLYNERDGKYKSLVEEIKNTVKDDYDARSSSNRAMTGTRIIYSPTGLDKVIHEYGTLDEYTVDARIVSTNGWLTPGCGFEESVAALVGTKDLAHLNKVTQWLHEKNAYLWRVNNAPSSEDERALVLGVDGGVRFNINANSNIIINRPARGVAMRKIPALETRVNP